MADSGQTEEVLATLRVIGRSSSAWTRGHRRYVVSFTRNAGDLAAVYELADAAMDGRPIELDVVPLFETGEDLQNSVEVLDNAIQLTQVRHRRLTANDRRFEVMLGTQLHQGRRTRVGDSRPVSGCGCGSPRGRSATRSRRLSVPASK